MAIYTSVTLCMLARINGETLIEVYHNINIVSALWLDVFMHFHTQHHLVN